MSPHGKEVQFAMQGIRQRERGGCTTSWSASGGSLDSGWVRRRLEAGFLPGTWASALAESLGSFHDSTEQMCK